MDIIGYVGCVFLFLSFIPHTYTLFKDDNVHRISPLFIGLILCASICMGVYAYQIQSYPVLIANGSVLINNMIILFLYLYKKKCTYTITEDGVLV